MTGIELRNIWDSIMDVTGGFDAEEDEFYRHINTAMVLLLKERTYARRKKRSSAEDPPFGFENTQYDSEAFQPLICDFTMDCKPLLFSDKKGRISFDEIRDAFPDDKIYDSEGLIETKKPEIFHINNLRRFGEKGLCPVKWRRHNEESLLTKDPFIKATDKYPSVVYYKDYLKVYPKGKAVFEASVMRMPRHVSKYQDPELPDAMMYEVIIKALALAGIQYRESDLFQYANLAEQNL